MIHEYVVRDKQGAIIESIDVEVAFGETPPEYVVSSTTKKRAYKNYGAIAFNIPDYMKAGTESADTYSTAKRAFGGASRRNRTSLRDVAKQQLRRS